jgi:hypothetical protein
MMPSIKSILAVGLVAFIIFMVLGFGYCYMKTSELEKTIQPLMAMAPGGVKLPPTILLAAGELYIWTGMATYTKFSGLADTMKALTQGFAGATGYGALAGSFLTPLINNLFGTVLPSTLFFYIFTIVAGFGAGILLLKKESRILDAIFSPLIPALILTIVMVIMTVFISTQLPSQAAAYTGGFLLGANDYIFIFLVSFVFFAIGTVPPQK